MKTTLSVIYTVDKCAFANLNGEHAETLDLSKLTNDDLEQYIAQCLVIKRQTMLRSKTADKLTLGTWTVPAPGKRISTSPVQKATAALNKLSEEQKKAIAEAMGFTYIPKAIAEPDPDLEAGEIDNDNEDEIDNEDN